MAGLECVAGGVAHLLPHCQVGEERGMSGHFAQRHTVGVSAADAHMGLESDVEALVGGHGAKDHLRGEVAGGLQWVSCAARGMRSSRALGDRHKSWYLAFRLPGSGSK